MPKENTSPEKKQNLSKQGDTSINNATILSRVDIFADVAIWSTAIGWGFCFFLIFIDMPSRVVDIAIRGIMLLNFVALLSGVVSLLRIKLKKNELSGTGRAVIGLSLSLLFWIIAPAVIKARQGAEVVQALYRIHELGTKISIYALKHGRYPVPDKWSDLLVVDDPNVNEFLRPDRHTGRGDVKSCIYAINPECEPNSSKDTILLFETKGGWNQFGGPELMNFENHSVKGACVLFRDCHVEFVRPDEVGELRWK